MASIALAVSLTLHVGEGSSSLRLRYARLPPAVQGMGYAVGLALVALFAPGTERFIYFQF